MKLAAIDIGSNSIHLIVVQIQRDGTWTVVDRARNMVGLASQTLQSGYLSESAIQSGLECLHTFRRMADAWGAEAIVAVATSATREAANGEHFVELIRAECGIDARIISGREEARLIYLGARNHIDWADRRALIVDIGGGSVEFIVGTQDTPDLFASLKLGVRRLSEEHLRHDPPTRPELKALRADIEGSLARLVRRFSDRIGFDFVVGTSGTLTNLALMAALKEGRQVTGRHGQWANLETIKTLARELSGMTAEQRALVPGLDPQRRETIIVGAQLAKYILRAVGKTAYVACDYALRDGLVADYVQRYGPGRRLAEDDEPSLRRRAVLGLYRKFNQSGAHPRQVSQLALSLFDQLQEAHGLSARCRELLEFAALLHDIGIAINARRHHKHSAYLIEHGDLHGFTREEILKIALVARYHRRALPERTDEGMRELSRFDQDTVLKMSALLRLANALDRSHSNTVAAVEARLTAEALHLDLYARSDAGLELWALESNAPLFERTFGRAVTAAAHPAQQTALPWVL